MTRPDVIENLFATLQLLDNTLHWLKRSYTICERIGCKEHYTDEEFDAFEAFTGRYARVADILIHKMYRAIDAVEMESGGTVLDVANRAHKRNLTVSVEELREIKDVRNEIAHEYVQSDPADVFEDVFRLTPKLFTLCENVKTYCKRYAV